MTKTMRTGYIVLGALLLAAMVVLLVTFAFDLAIWQALLLLAVLDAAIVYGGWRAAKRAAQADKREAS